VFKGRMAEDSSNSWGIGSRNLVGQKRKTVRCRDGKNSLGELRSSNTKWYKWTGD
jgi:hypothetical protein